jgi:hypothetical protein
MLFFKIKNIYFENCSAAPNEKNTILPEKITYFFHMAGWPFDIEKNNGPHACHFPCADHIPKINWLINGVETTANKHAHRNC